MLLCCDIDGGKWVFVQKPLSRFILFYFLPVGNTAENTHVSVFILMYLHETLG